MENLLKCCIFLFVILLVKSQESSDNPEVSTLTGTVTGLVQNTTAGTPFYKFLGVPYAEPPVGNLRFRDPIAKKAWKGSLNATEFPTKCPQISFSLTLEGSEDCLYLNIYTPTLPIPSYWVPKSLKPVMFWIHGGGFTQGDSNSMANPELFLDEDVLLVTVHYRLGPLGFLAIEDNPDLAGNIGLKDQQQALLWVNQNIKYFGGDPAKVTIFGESAGAVSVHAHILSPRIKNIFQGAILQSGTALMSYEPYFVEGKVQQSSRRYIEKMGCNDTNLIECLQSENLETLMEVSEYSDYETGEANFDDYSSYWMVQDSSSLDPVLPYNPLQQMVEGNVKKVPLINGVTKDDGGLILISDKKMENSFKNNNSTELMAALGLATENVTKGQILAINTMKRFYFSEGTYEDNEKNLLEISTDSWFGSPAAEVSKLHSKVSSVYPYVLNERCTDFSFAIASYFGGEDDKDWGVSHADDLNCFFTPIPEYGTLTENGKKISKAMVKAWTNFAKYEDPSPYLSSDPTWPKGEIMFFETESSYQNNKEQLENLLARHLLWDKLYWDPLETKSKAESIRKQQNILTYVLPYNWFPRYP